MTRFLPYRFREQAGDELVFIDVVGGERRVPFRIVDVAPPEAVTPLFLAWPTYENIWSMFSRPLFLASGVIFLIDDLPDPIFHILWWNPVAHVVAEMRHAFYPGYGTSFVSPGYVFLIAGISFLIGLISLHRFVYDVLDR